MLFESARQAPLFAVFICLGILQGIFYDILYLLRYKRRGVMLHLSDIVFSIFFFISTLVTTLLFNSGKLEWFFFLGIISGFCAERATLGLFIKISIDFFKKILYNLSKRLRIGELFKRILK